jgi:hypothetical protein
MWYLNNGHIVETLTPLAVRDQSEILHWRLGI